MYTRGRKEIKSTRKFCDIQERQQLTHIIGINKNEHIFHY